MDKPQQQAESISFGQVVFSVLASFFGVQSSKARERDFTRGNPTTFLVMGFVLTSAFALILLVVVRLITHSIAA